jgi:PAN domain
MKNYIYVLGVTALSILFLSPSVMALELPKDRKVIGHPATPVVMLSPGMEGDTNRPGLDYRNFDAGTAAQCQTTCNTEAQCKAWTWVKPGAQSQNGHCWLKNGVPGVAKSDCCVSGLRTVVSSNTPMSKSVDQVNSSPLSGKINKSPVPAKVDLGIPKINSSNLPNSETKTSGLGGKAVSTNGQANNKSQFKNAPVMHAKLKRVMNNKPGLSPKAQDAAIRAENSTAESIYRQKAGSNKYVLPDLTQPRITKINGKSPKGFIFRPGGAVAIEGVGFGKSGKITLIGNFNHLFKNSGFSISEQTHFQVTGWRDDIIYARLDNNISDEEDLSNVRLEVTPSGKSAIVVNGTKFEAARAEVLLGNIPMRYVRLNGETAMYATGGQRPDILKYGFNGFDVNVPAKSAIVVRLNKNHDWFSPATDIFTLPLRPGFSIQNAEFWHGRTDSNSSHCDGEEGGQYVQGNYDISIENDNTLNISWAVWRCHVSWTMFSSEENSNHSIYAVNVYVLGPRGVNPLQ